MPLTDFEIIEKFKLKSTDRVLDVGGSMKQHQEIKVDTLVDLIRPEESPYNKSTLLAKKFVRVDVTKEKLPFKDKKFDFCLCTHTLEDLYNPFRLIDEMSRVARRGYITTPSMGKDMVFSHFNLIDWRTGARRVPGVAHHKWFFIKQEGIMQIIPKNYSLLYTPRFHVTKWKGDDEFQYYWQEKIKYREIKDYDFSELINFYTGFLDRNRKKTRIGSTLFFWDNPYYLIKEVVKFFITKFF